ncbi:MAG: ATP-dependent Clp protease ATP-binding subunit [Acidobacteria bacterium]|nr:ATP-dependent Clp protease ATP-binding subunit [Acidobacteriota bacterium]MBI3655027.1 ATP-dependent Clp protease ATP-binding subunit [Acidobacteriota bacterium]
MDWAIVESIRRGNTYLSEDYILYALTEVAKDWFEKAMADLGVDATGVRSAIERSLASYSYKKANLGHDLRISPNAEKLIRSAKESAEKSGRDKIEIIDLMIAIFICDDGRPLELLRYFGIEADYIANKTSFEKAKTQFQESGTEKTEKLPSVFKNFGVSLNVLARQNKIPPIIGREAEINQMAEILCHRERANSVMLVGDPGVGKTAVVEGLARRLVWEADTLPRRLRNIQIINLQMNRVVAGTMFRGMFEERMQAIVNELKKREDLVLFVDEAHTMIGAGSALGAPTDAADILKSALAKGEVRMIGATTYEEYKEYIAEDAALSRRFRLVKVAEPSLDETRVIVTGLKPRLEENYSVGISQEAIDTALNLAPRYMRSLRMPDKVIGWLDTAAVKVEIAHAGQPAPSGMGSNWKEKMPRGVVTTQDVIKVISQDARIPEDMICRETGDRLRLMEEALSRRVVGQREAIGVLSDRLRLNKGPLKENFYKPDGVFLFLGPTGVGKTELAKALAEFLFGDDMKMIRIDMSEYQDGTVSVEKLIGMPRGIVGSERGGILTAQLQENPYTVLLLDEIEKSSPLLLHLFLQAFDEGWLTDGRGKKAYLSDAVVVMTSNLGSDNFKRFTQPLGFMSSDGRTNISNVIRSEVLKEAERRFTPEFRNRIDEFVVFSPLTREEVKDIATLNIKRITQRLAGGGKGLTITDEAMNLVVERGFSMEYGARFLKRTMDELITIPLTKHLKQGDTFTVSALDGEIVVNVG